MKGKKYIIQTDDYGDVISVKTESPKSHGSLLSEMPELSRAGRVATLVSAAIFVAFFSWLWQNGYISDFSVVVADKLTSGDSFGPLMVLAAFASSLIAVSILAAASVLLGFILVCAAEASIGYLIKKAK